MGLPTTNTPYDDVFRTLLNDCSSLILPLINEVFHETYSGEETILFSPNEHFLNRQDGKEEERITDSSFKVLGKETKKYHLECQSSPDNSMLIRFFEYDTQIALDEGELTGNILTVTFPHSAVLFLRCQNSTPDKLRIRMVTPGGHAEYAIPVMKSQQYTMEQIFDRQLLLLLPFHIFSHEKQFAEYEKDESKRRSLQKEYAQIRHRLEELLEQDVISEYTKRTLIDLSGKVLDHIAVKYDSVRKGVKSVMGGRVLEYEAKTIKREGIREGIEQGIEQGIHGTVSILKNLGVPPQTILLQIQQQYHLTPEESEKYL